MTPNPKDAPPFLNMTERQAGDVTILELAGNIIMGGGSALLRDALSRLVQENRKKIILDLAAVKYMDSSGVGELLSGLKMLNGNGAQLKLLNLSERVEEVMSLSHLLSMFEIYQDEAKALSDFE